MPLLSIFRFIFTLLSWLVLAGAIYFLWRWWDGSVSVDDAGNVTHYRETWVLVLGAVLAAWSVGGRLFWRLVLAHGRDGVGPSRGSGTMIAGVDGDQLYVETAGQVDGPTLILTHGAGNDSTIWYLARHALGQRYRLLLWDLPGLGKSKGKIDLERYAENLRIVIQSAGGPVLLAGHSMGGMVIQTLARRHPEMFGTQILGTMLLNTTYTNPLKTMIVPRVAQALRPLLEVAHVVQIALFPLAWISSWQSYLSGSAHLATRLTFGKGVTRTQLDHAALLGTRNSPVSIARGNLAMFRWSAEGAVANIVDPLLVVAGDGDIVTKAEASEFIAGTALSPRFHIVPNSNHMSFLDHAEEYHRLIDNYFDEALDRAGQLKKLQQPVVSGGRS
jgi:pimeloyl-ACP methyl ester carboxylesterase